MILSFHPLFPGDHNILCAGRDPGPGDLTAIRSADAVILPQGCRRSLYEMARNNCVNVFPDYEMRFRYPGKIGQTELFTRMKVPFPKTEAFRQTSGFHEIYGSPEAFSTFAFPFVFKFNWGGEGDTVFLTSSNTELKQRLKKAQTYEKAGQSGFLLQELVPCDNRCLRVVVIGQEFYAYWRIQDDGAVFGTSLTMEGRIDHESDPDLQQMAVLETRRFCQRTGINLAGFDFLFSSVEKPVRPYFLEINYFFGRKGLGGSEKYYAILNHEILNWLDRQKRH